MVSRTGLRIGKILGIPIYLHASWVFVFVLYTLSLGWQFSQIQPKWSSAEQWTAGIITSLLFFGSVVFHELSHSMVAQHYKIRVVSITLFIFGGVAHIERDPYKAIQEFNIAVAGPIASAFLAALFYAASILAPSGTVWETVPYWLAEANGVLAAFNLLPGFPLDGGRIFRAIVWGIKKNYFKATKIAGTSGRLVAYAMIVLGAWLALGMKGYLTAGIWLAFIGWFLLNAAQESVAQVAIRETLSGLRAFDVMSHEVPTISASSTLEDYGAEVLRTGRRCHLVLMDDKLVGLMNVHALNSMPRSDWTNTSVQAVMIPRDKILWAHPDEPLLGLLERLLTADVNQMPVVSGSGDGTAQVVGMVTRDSILRVIQTRTELGSLQASR